MDDPLKKFYRSKEGFKPKYRLKSTTCQPTKFELVKTKTK